MRRALGVFGLVVLWVGCGFAQLTKPITHPPRSPKAFTYHKYKPKKHPELKHQPHNPPHR